MQDFVLLSPPSKKQPNIEDEICGLLIGYLFVSSDLMLQSVSVQTAEYNTAPFRRTQHC